MSEEKEERRCDLCQDEKELPCIGKNCHSGNGLQGFRPKTDTIQGDSEGVDFLLALELNEEAQTKHGRYIRVPGGWVFETDRGACCFVSSDF